MVLIGIDPYPYKWGIFQLAMFDDTRGSICCFCEENHPIVCLRPSDMGLGVGRFSGAVSFESGPELCKAAWTAKTFSSNVS